MHLDLRHSAQDNSPKVRKILKYILVLNLLVTVIKLFIGFTAGSLSIISDGIHSMIDSLNNVIGIFAIKVASDPPDPKHPYGHSKFETLGALSVVAFLAIASFELIEKSLTRLLDPSDLPHIDSNTIWLLLLTLVINIFVWLYESSAAKKLNSLLLSADAKHTLSDVLVTITILLSMFFIFHGYNWIDPVLSLIIAFVILHSGWSILKETIPILVDEAWLKPEEISNLVLSTDKVVAFEALRSRKVHDEAFIELTIRVSTDSLREAHEISHEVEEKITHVFGHAHVTIHVEPSGT